jgi:hypothetical protein
MKYAVDLGSAAMTYIPSFVKISSGSLKLMGDTHTYTHRQQDDLISLLSFFLKKAKNSMRSIPGYCQ